MASARLRATAFWNEFHTQYPNERVYNLMTAVAEGTVDWFREASLTNVAIAEHCRIGRLGFDQEKFEAGQMYVRQLLDKHELTGLMQA